MRRTGGAQRSSARHFWVDDYFSSCAQCEGSSSSSGSSSGPSESSSSSFSALPTPCDCEEMGCADHYILRFHLSLTNQNSAGPRSHVAEGVVLVAGLDAARLVEKASMLACAS